MIRRFLTLVLALFVIGISANAQIREVPPIVKDAFYNQYPKAEEVAFKDLLASVQVYFTVDGEKMLAKYSNKGIWKETEKDWSYDQLSETVKDGFTKSKYADWEVKETKVVYRGSNTELYRIKVEKNEVQKKYLYFNKQGRLLGDSITI